MKQIPFLWGVATSAHQVEGRNDKNDWAEWEKEGKIEGGVHSGDACDHWNLFKKDIQLVRDLGANTYRFSLEWSRLEPSPDSWHQPSFEHYDDVIAACEKMGIIPMITLHHFTSPLWFATQGGFAHRGATEAFSRFVRKVAKRWGTRVPYWCTVNEPLVLVVGGYLGKFMPPAVYSPAQASKALTNLLRCHVDAYDILDAYRHKRTGAYEDHPLMIGYAHNVVDFLPKRAWHPIERLLVYYLRKFYNDAWVDATLGEKQGFGVPGLLPAAPEVKRARKRVTTDFIGLNYYTKAYVRWKPVQQNRYLSPDLPLQIYHAHPHEDQSDVGWALHVDGFEKCLRRFAKKGLPLIITENGIADSQDKHHPRFINDHLKKLKELKKEGLDIRGYYHWSLLDNFEWVLGYGPRFGLYEVDYETQKRTPRRSAQVFEKWTKKF